MDQAARLLKQAPFDSATVHLLCCVLEDGWAQIRASYASARAEEIGRCNVADGILAYARAGRKETVHEDYTCCGLYRGGGRLRAGSSGSRDS
jgi:hypothetical protein